MSGMQRVNSSTAELFASIFLSFEAVIVNAIFIFKQMKNNIIYKHALPKKMHQHYV